MNMNNEERKQFERNYWALTFEGVCFIGGISMLSTGGVIAVFIYTMTGSVALVGLGVTIQSLALLLGQLVIAPYMDSIRNLPGFLFKVMLLRICPFLMALPLFLGVSPVLAAWIALFFFGLFWFFDGTTAVPWGELVSRTIKPELRGQMMGTQVALGGGISLLTGLLLTWLLATPRLTDHHRFAIIFTIGAIILLTALIFIRMVKDPSPIVSSKKPDIWKYYAGIPTLIRQHKHLRRAIVARIPGYIGFSTITFTVVFGSSVMDISDAQLSWLVYSQIVGTLIGGYVLGKVSRLFGNKPVILLCNLGVVVTLGMAITLATFPTLGYIWLIATCVFASIWFNNWLGYFNYFLDIAPRDKRPTFQVVGNCIGIPFSFIGYFIGFTIDRWGFVFAFVVGGIAAIVTMLVTLKLLSRKQINELANVEIADTV